MIRQGIMISAGMGAVYWQFPVLYDLLTFLSPNVASVLAYNFEIGGIIEVTGDMEMFLKLRNKNDVICY